MKSLSDNGIEKAMVSNPTNILYLTGTRIKPYERFLAFILDSKSQKTTFILPSLEKSVNTDSTISKVFCGDHEDPMKKLMDVLGACEILGVEKDYITLSLSEKVADQDGVQLVDISPLIQELRLCKDSEEINNIKIAIGYSDQVLGEIRKQIRAGRTEKEITFDMLQRMSLKPGVRLAEFIIQVLSGENSANPHGTAGDKKIETGDPITIDFGIEYAHYWSDCTRTFFPGKPDPQFESIYRVVLEAQKKAIAKIRPGIPIHEIDLSARQAIEKAGYGEFFIHRTGHGIGLDIHELPSVHGQNEEILKEGMVITVEPGIYIPGAGGVRIEDDVVVSGEGGAVLNTYPKEYEDMIIKD